MWRDLRFAEESTIDLRHDRLLGQNVPMFFPHMLDDFLGFALNVPIDDSNPSTILEEIQGFLGLQPSWSGIPRDFYANLFHDPWKKLPPKMTGSCSKSGFLGGLDIRGMSSLFCCLVLLGMLKRRWLMFKHQTFRAGWCGCQDGEVKPY